MLKMDGDIHIRYMTVAQLKALLSNVDDSLLVTCAPITGNLLFYTSDNFAYEDMHSLIDFNEEELKDFTP